LKNTFIKKLTKIKKLLEIVIFSIIEILADNPSLLLTG